MEPTDLTLEILKAIRGDIHGIKADIHEMKGEIRETQGDIHEMKGDIHEMKGDIRGMKGDIRGMKGDIRGMKADIREIHVTLGVHHEAIVKLVHEVHAVNDRMDNFLQGAHHDDHVDLHARIGQLEAKVG
jgi:uncharacterized coiled-coil DUF342 family protein